MMQVLDLFSGIGGFSLGLERTGGFKTAAFCEIEPFCQKVLKKHWPEVPIYNDIKEINGYEFNGSIDLVCGGFPCQDLSTAGKKAGFEGERSSLYREMLRIISECQPEWAIFENVTGLLTGGQGTWFSQFLNDLAKIGYDAEWHCISASYLGAKHHRDRVWIIAYPEHNGSAAAKVRQSVSERNAGNKKRQDTTGKSARLSGKGIFANTRSEQLQGGCKISHYLKQQIEFARSSEDVRDRFNLSEPPLCGTNDGISDRSHRLKALGNSVVPAIPEPIGNAILAMKMINNPKISTRE